MNVKRSSRAKLIVFFSLIVLLLATASTRAATPTLAEIAGRYEARVFTDSLGNKLPYRLYVPGNYTKENTYPLTLFLHGSGEAGTDNISQLANTGPDVLSDSLLVQNHHPSFVVCPQCPNGTQWGNYEGDLWPTTAVVQLIKALQNEFSIDTNRIYLTGLSLGGLGTWYIVAQNAGVFAAAVPVAAGGELSKSNLYTHTPIWAFHGTADPAVAFAGHTSWSTQVYGDDDMVKAVNNAGGNAMLTAYKGWGHDSWLKAYRDKSMIQWLFAQVKNVPFVSDTSILLNKNKIEINVRDTLSLFANVLPVNASNHFYVNWQTSDYKILTVETNGLIKGIKGGEAKVYAISKSGLTDSCVVKVNVVPVQSIALNIDSAELKIGATLTLSFLITPSNASNLNALYLSTDNTIASVNSKGLVKALAGGAAYIWIKSIDGFKTDSCKITVNDPLEVIDNKRVERFCVFPNPVCDGRVTLQSSNYNSLNNLNVEICNTSGNTLYKSVLRKSNAGFVLNAGFLKSGIYFIKMKGGNYFGCEKLVIM